MTAGAAAILLSWSAYTSAPRINTSIAKAFLIAGLTAEIPSNIGSREWVWDVKPI